VFEATPMIGNSFRPAILRRPAGELTVGSVGFAVFVPCRRIIPVAPQ
jgi:hypothetical protein